MNKLIIPFLFIACLFMTACGNDEPKPELTADYLEATTWDAQLTGLTYPSSEPLSSHFVMQFLTKDTGKCIPAYGSDIFEGSFTYQITKEMITFNGSLTGNWSLIEKSNTKMVLQAFLPYEFNLVLAKK